MEYANDRNYWKSAPVYVGRTEPVVLCDFVDAYAKDLRRRPKAAAYELWQIFAELAEERQRCRQPAHLQDSICWVGTVEHPERNWHPSYQISAARLADYFRHRVTDNGQHCELIRCTTADGQNREVSDAAIAFAPEPLVRLIEGISRPVPRFLLESKAYAATSEPPDGLPKGKRLNSVRDLVCGLIEMVANAATRDKDDPFCKVAAELDANLPGNTTASNLLYLADKLKVEDFPGRNTIKEILK